MSNPYPLTIYEVRTGRLPGWSNEPIQLTIPSGAVTGVLEDHPVMLILSPSAGVTNSDLSQVLVALGEDSNRKRICVTEADGITPLYVEITEWDRGVLRAVLWVRVPRINPGEETRLYFYYDANHAEMTDYVGDTGEPAAQMVWSNGYSGVWHMKSVDGVVLDSTPHEHHGTIYGATETTGPLGKCLSFDGVDDYIEIAQSLLLRPDTGTLHGYLTHRGEHLMGEGGVWMDAATSTQNRLLINDLGRVRAQYRIGGADVLVDAGSGHNIPVDTPAVFGLTHDGDRLSIFLNGVGVVDTPATGTLGSGTSPISIGRGQPDIYYFDGTIYQITISSIARSPAWIAATTLSLRDELIVYGAAPAPLALAAYVDAYEYLSWTRRYRRPGAWRCQINRYLPAAKEFVPGRIVHFRRNGEDRLALIETRQISVDVSGRPSEQWTVAGRELLGILGDRLCLHGVSTGTGYDDLVGAAETAMRHYVDVNAINPANPTRIVPFLSLATTDDERGGTVTQRARFDVLTDLLESICAASGLGYRGGWSWDDRRLVFEVVQGIDRTDSVILSPALGNCTIKGYNESTSLAPSVAVVAGQGVAEERLIAETATDIGLTGFARRELFVDARDCETEPELLQRGTEKLAEDGDTTTLEVEYIQTASYRYGEDFDLGDIVHVEYPDIAAIDTRIVEITEEYAREGENITLTLGTEWPDLVSLIRARQKENVVTRT